MNNATINKPKIYYSNIFISIMLTIAITIFTISAILYYRFEQISTSLIYNSAKENLIQVSHSIDNMKENTKSLALQIYYDSEISNLMYLPSPTQEDITSVLKRLDYFRFSNTSFIESIYVYNRQSESMYVSASANSTPIADINHFFDAEMIKIINNIQNYNNMEFTPRKIPIPMSRRNEPLMIDGYSYLYYDSVTAGVLNSAVVLNVSERWLNNMVNSLNSNQKQNTLIINNRGIALTNSGSYQMFTDVNGEEHIRRILESSEEADYFIEQVNGVKSLVSFVNMKQTGWIFVMTIPYEHIVGKIVEMRNYTILIGFVILLLGLLTSFMISKRIYKPIAVTLGKIDLLIKEKRESSYKQRQDYLISLLHGNTELDREKMNKRLNAQEIKLSFDEATFLLLLKVDNFASFCSTYEYADRKILKYAISNIASELCSPHWWCEAIDAGDDHVAMIISDASEERSHLRETIANIQEMTKKHLDLSISITVSTTANSLEDVCNVYSDALAYSSYRVFKGHSCMIDVAETAANENKEYLYPIHKEDLLIQNLLLGKIPAVKDAYTSIMQNAMDASYSAYSSALLRLFSSINYAIFNLSKDYPVINYNSAQFSENLGGLELKADVDDLLFDLFEHVASCIDAKKSLRNVDIIDTIKEIIQKNYSSSDLCLNMVADQVGMNPVYLGRLFKKLTQLSVGEYINHCRMEIAKDMLTNNKLTIGEIAERIGISNKPHFYTLFKKHYGVTPNDFRVAIKQHG